MPSARAEQVRRTGPARSGTPTAPGTPTGTGTGTALGDFLRSRRAALQPESAGLRADLRRRQVQGLRREELAELAGLSVDYYTRLEQGRERRPSEQVLDALARALRLGTPDVAHLFRLARPVSPLAEPEPVPDVAADVLSLVNAQLRVPVAVLGPALDVLALNPVGRVFYRGFTRTDNLLQMIFCDPAAPDFYAEWQETCQASVASVQAVSAQFPRHERIAAVVDELSAASPDFAALWTAREVSATPCVETHRIRHPDVGQLDLYCSTLAVVGVPGQVLHVFSAPAGSESAGRLAQLADDADQH